MATIKPFRCIRPEVDKASKIAALPYDVYSSEEAKAKVHGDNYSFLRIDRAETQFEEKIAVDDPRVYDKARQILDNMIENGDFITDNDEKYYIYELTMNGRTQTGIVACASIDDYCNNVIKKHENTREDKELDRINMVDGMDSSTYVKILEEDVFNHSQYLYVYSTKGEVIVLPIGATALDFAFKIDSNAAIKIKKVLINGLECSMDTKLKNGCIVSVKYGNIVTINKDWIEYATSNYTKAKIKKYLENL